MDFQYDFDHILCPVDLSATSGIAVRHAAYLASRFQARLTLLHVKDAFSEQILKNEFGSVQNDKVYLEFATTKLNEWKKSLDDEFKTRCEVKVSNGKIMDVIDAFLKSEKVSDLVVGVHGDKHRDPFYAGGNAYKIVQHCKLPVLQVDDASTEIRYKNILMPIDDSFHTREKVPYAAKLAKAYGSKILLPALHTTSNKDIVSSVDKVLHQVAHYIHQGGVSVAYESVHTNSSVKETLSLADKHNADLIIIVCEYESAISRLFSEPAAQQVMAKSKRPILAVPPKVEKMMSSVSI